MDYSSRLPNELPFFIRIRGFAEYGIYSRMESNGAQKRNLLLSLHSLIVWHHSCSIGLIVGLQPLRLIDLNAI